MAQSHDISPRADPPISSSSVGIPRLGLDGQRLRRYLPPDQAEEIVRDLSGPDAPPNQVVEAFVHLACARSAIGSYLPRMLTQQLLEERLESPWLSWVEGSLLFADLSGSTALAERLGALGREGIEMVTACLNQIFTILIQVIQDYGGDLISFGGDALLVFFGDERHPRTAARAAGQSRPSGRRKGARRDRPQAGATTSPHRIRGDRRRRGRRDTARDGGSARGDGRDCRHAAPAAIDRAARHCHRPADADGRRQRRTLDPAGRAGLNTDKRSAS